MRKKIYIFFTPTDKKTPIEYREIYTYNLEL